MTLRTSTEERLAIYPDRLDFVLGSFVRIAWASAVAERAWSSRFSRVRAAITHVEWMSVIRKLRPCALLQLRGQDIETCAGLWVTQGLAWRALSESSPRIGAWWLDASLSRDTAAQAVVVGSEPDTAAFERAWEVGDHESMGTLLGYPSCCRLFFEEVCIAHRCIDTVWAMSEREQRMDDRASARFVDGSIASNILLQSLGIRAVPHAPCGFGCRETALLAEKLSGVAATIGYEEEYRWLPSILSWPAEWSALHGIAEIRTPILKLCTPTDATAGEYLVRWNGSAPPSEAAKGIGFPYRTAAQPHVPALVNLTPKTYADPPDKR
jgi:hypothetical protein